MDICAETFVLCLFTEGCREKTDKSIPNVSKQKINDYSGKYLISAVGLKYKKKKSQE